MGMKWVWIILAILYVVSRIDLIPDMIVGWGWIDDIVILGLLFRYLAKRRLRTAYQQQDASGQQQQSADGSGRNQGERSHPKSPHEILGVAPNASKEEIRAAYRQLAAQYHPDKVTHLGKEFQEMADQRFKDIQEAYQKLK